MQILVELDAILKKIDEHNSNMREALTLTPRTLPRLMKYYAQRKGKLTDEPF